MFMLKSKMASVTQRNFPPTAAENVGNWEKKKLNWWTECLELIDQVLISVHMDKELGTFDDSQQNDSAYQR